MVILPQCRANLMIGNSGKTWGAFFLFSASSISKMLILPQCRANLMIGKPEKIAAFFPFAASSLPNRSKMTSPKRYECRCVMGIQALLAGLRERNGAHTQTSSHAPPRTHSSQHAIPKIKTSNNKRQPDNKHIMTSAHVN